MAKRYPEIRLISTPIRSKADAWNTIRKNARSDIIVYSDADIVAERDAIRLLYEDLAINSELQLVGANLVMRIEGSKGLMKLINPVLAKSPPKAILNGRLYAIRRSVVEEIPLNVINEDEWLSLKVLTSGDQRFKTNADAKAHYTPPLTLTDYIKYRLRCDVGDYQIKMEYPELDRSHSSTFKGRGRFLIDLPLNEKMVLPLLACIYFYCKFASGIAYKRESITHEYEVIKSTKRVL